MSLPFFYVEEMNTDASMLTLDEPTSRHVIQVLRMRNGEKLQLTNGLGKKLLAELRDQSKKSCAVAVLEQEQVPPPAANITLAVSLLKNNARFEWLIEKATEMGVGAIIPLLCDRTEKSQFRKDRMHNILVSAMLQSQQCWLPLFPEPVRFMQWVETAPISARLIAHCMEGDKTPLARVAALSGNKSISIGPEGDFTPQELSAALKSGFNPVSLGNTRLRTETAAVAATALLCIP